LTPGKQGKSSKKGEDQKGKTPAAKGGKPSPEAVPSDLVLQVLAPLDAAGNNTVQALDQHRRQHPLQPQPLVPPSGSSSRAATKEDIDATKRELRKLLTLTKTAAVPGPVPETLRPAPAGFEEETKLMPTEDVPAVSGETLLAPRIPTQIGDHVFNPLDEFCIILDRTNGAKIGMDVDSRDGTTLLVDQVTGGLAGDWNRRIPHCPVKPGDLIVEVNGFRDLPSLVKECKKNTVLKIQLVRRSSGRDPDPAV